MITIESIRKKSLQELLTYREALVILINKYETLATPRFARIGQFDNVTESEMTNANKLNQLRGNLSSVLMAIEEKVLNELDEETQERATNKPVETAKPGKKPAKKKKEA